MHPSFGKPVLLLPLRCCWLSPSCIWSIIGEKSSSTSIIHTWRAPSCRKSSSLAPTYHYQAIMKARNFIPKQYSLTCTTMINATFFWWGLWQSRCCILGREMEYNTYPRPWSWGPLLSGVDGTVSTVVLDIIVILPPVHNCILPPNIKPLHYLSTQPFEKWKFKK